MIAFWRNLGWWDRVAHLLIGAALVYVVAAAAGWDFLGDAWLWFAVPGVALLLVCNVGSWVDLRRKEREADTRQAEFDVKLRELGWRP